jgi:hypothetical protein
MCLDVGGLEMANLSVATTLNVSVTAAFYTI